MLKTFKRKIKNTIHKFEFLDKLAFSVWGFFWIARAWFVLRKIKKISKNNSAGPVKIVIPALRAIPTTNLVWFDAIFGHAFKKLGAEVKMLYCAGLMNSCDANNVFRNQKTSCFNCKLFGPAVRKVLGLDNVFYKDYISELDIKNIKKEVADLKDKELLNHNYCGINVGIHAHASAIRYFLFGKLDLNNPEQVKVLRDKLVLAMITAKVAKEITDKEKPDVFFMLHGNYSTWGPFHSYARLKDIETFIYCNMPPRFGYFVINRNEKAEALTSRKEWEKTKNIPLTVKEEAEIDDYLNSRFRGETGDHKIYVDNFDENIKREEILNIPLKGEYKKRYILCPNLAWDAQIEGAISDIFEDVFEWLDKTIDFFKQRKDYQLIIRPHPAEMVWERCAKGVGSRIKEKYGSLPDNIVLLPANIPLRTYDLIKPGIIVLVYNGTIGLEAAASGSPVLSAANVHYKDAGIVYRAGSLEEYFNILENPEKIIRFAEHNQRLAKKYAHYYFFRTYVRIPFYKKDKWSVIDWGAVKNANKLFNDNSNIIKISKNILNKKDIVEPL